MKTLHVYQSHSRCIQQLTVTCLVIISDFLPMFIYVLAHCGLVSAEIEADYMWGLLHPCLLAGEGGYYLTTLSSAVHVLKNMKAAEEMDDTITKVSRSRSLTQLMS